MAELSSRALREGARRRKDVLAIRVADAFILLWWAREQNPFCGGIVVYPDRVAVTSEYPVIRLRPRQRCENLTRADSSEPVFPAGVIGSDG
jgi:hypothetical protein